MAIKLTANYAKRLGLPGFSSHQFSVTCETELTDLSQVPEEAARLYGLLQDSVDREMQQTGFVPDEEYGCNSNPVLDGRNDVSPSVDSPAWQCSDRQHELITELADELQLDQSALDRRSVRLFKRPACELNKLCASGLISDLLAEAGTKRQREGRGAGSAPSGNGKGGSLNGDHPAHRPNGSTGRTSVYARRNGGPRPVPSRNGGAA